MKEWTRIRELKFQDRTVAIERSNAAMRKWKVVTEKKTGETEAHEHETEKMAFHDYYNSAKIALTTEAALWE